MKNLHTPIEPKQLHPMLLDDSHIGKIVAFDCRERMLTIQVDEMPSGKKPGHRLGARAILVFLPERPSVGNPTPTKDMDEANDSQTTASVEGKQRRVGVAYNAVFSPLRLLVSAEVRYWEDAEINGVSDEDGTLVPLKVGDIWKPSIELETGRVLEWPQGTTADIHFKVCDQGEYWLEDAEGNRLKWKGDYVPNDLLAIGDNGYGDYIIMKISAEGIIEGWPTPRLRAEDWENASDQATARK